MKVSFSEKLIIVIGVSLLLSGCNNHSKLTDQEEVADAKKRFIENYAKIVFQSYKDSYDMAVVLQTAVNEFVSQPTAIGLENAKKAWLGAREPYGQTEVFRESGGPIDTPNGGIEGQINAWPLDENYIDYVRKDFEDPKSSVTSEGIINDLSFTINEASLKGANEGISGGYNVPEKNVSTGYHAIEFLLWGQDAADPRNGLSGQRPFTDYRTDGIGTNNNQDRRGLYLKLVTELLVKDLKSLVDAWSPSGEYRNAFLKLPQDEALKNIMRGLFFMAGEELSTERMAVAVEQSQEDEHSCFSDNTHRDIFANAKGINNIVFGTYQNIQGLSLYDLVKEADATQAEKLKEASETAMNKVQDIMNAITDTQKFDGLIEEESLTSGGVIMKAVEALKNQADEISASAMALEVSI